MQMIQQKMGATTTCELYWTANESIYVAGMMIVLMMLMMNAPAMDYLILKQAHTAHQPND